MQATCTMSSAGLPFMQMVPGSMFVIAGLMASVPSTPSQRVPQKTLRALRTQSPVIIDGLATEEAWAHAPLASGFAERSPNLNARPPVATTVRAIYDDQNLYVLVESEMQDRRFAKAQNLRRDSGNIFADDFIDLKIDPLRDLRSAYAFVTNAAGAQYDALALEDGRVYFRRWDAVWKTKSSSSPGKLVTEYQIPLYVLGIRNAKSLVMGFNVTRRDYSRPADYDWRLIPPPLSGVGASSFGILSGLTNLNSRAVVELVPYALATTNFSKSFSIDPRKQPNLAAGFDARFQTGPGGYIEGSVLTDFSQVDADQVQVANDRFPLFFPERRPFFLNGADVFNFGHASTAQIYFSRRIGLNGQVTPILGGLKAYGRRKKFSYGAMAVQTGRSFGDKNSQNAATFGVSRLRVQPLPQLSVGVIAVGRKVLRNKGEGDALSLGIDLDIRSLDNRMRSYSFVAGTWSKPQAKPSEDPPQEATATSGWTVSNRTEYRHLFVRPALTWLWSSRDFTAPLGFYTRPNTAQHEAELLFAPRPELLNLRELSIGPSFAVVTDSDYRRRLTYRGRFDFKFFWNNKWGLGYFFEGTQDRVLQEFPVFGDQLVKPGAYKNLLHGVWLDSPGQHMVSTALEYNGGSRFGGPYHKASAKINARLSRYFALDASYNHSWGKLPNAASWFSVGSANARTVLSLSTQITLDWLMRLDMTPTRAAIGNQARFRWRFAQGSDLFLVYANRVPLEKQSSQVDTEHRLSLKFNWYTTFRVGSKGR